MGILKGLHHALGRMALYAIPDVRWCECRWHWADEHSPAPQSQLLLRDPLSRESFMLDAMQRLIRPQTCALWSGGSVPKMADDISSASGTLNVRYAR